MTLLRVDMSDTTRLVLPLIAAAQAQKHVTHNEAILKLDGLIQMSAASFTTTAEPATPADGDLYLLPPGKTGTHWSSAANQAVAHFYDGVWHFYTPSEGWTCWVRDSDILYVFGGTTWSNLAGAQSFTPTITYQTPGDLSVAYTTQVGLYYRLGSLVVFTGRVGFTPTFTTASGNCRIGVPWTNSNPSLGGGFCSVGPAPTYPSGKTWLTLGISSGASALTINAHGSASSVAVLTAAQIVSGTTWDVIFGGVTSA
jgi:hypothetical protein